MSKCCISSSCKEKRLCCCTTKTLEHGYSKSIESYWERKLCFFLRCCSERTSVHPGLTLFHLLSLSSAGLNKESVLVFALRIKDYIVSLENRLSLEEER